MFVDSAIIQLTAGKGGNGIIAWRRAKFLPKGGPAGGNGGTGGSIILESDPELYSLEHLRNRRIIRAQNGRQGGTGNCKGKNGEDLILKLPLGTLVKHPITKKLLFDLTEIGQRWKICAGGKGGKGNTHFKTSTHQAPYICTEGKPGNSCEVEFELKLIADIGLVGMPNAGKSTLISRLANINVKIAPYPFTTLRPNLGILNNGPEQRILIADIPGIIAGAHKNKGLGFAFLRHIERTSLLLFLIELAPYQERDPYEDFQILRHELNAYNPSLLEKPFLIVLNKIDQEGAAELIASFRSRYQGRGALLHTSALKGIGLIEVKEAISSLLHTSRSC